MRQENVFYSSWLIPVTEGDLYEEQASRKRIAISVSCFWMERHSSHNQARRGVQVYMSMSPGQPVLLQSSLSENVNQMFSDHVRPGFHMQKKVLAFCLYLWLTPVSLPLIPPRAFCVALWEKQQTHWLGIWKKGICHSAAFITTEIRCSVPPRRGNLGPGGTCNAN